MDWTDWRHTLYEIIQWNHKWNVILHLKHTDVVDTHISHSRTHFRNITVYKVPKLKSL
jgi:hypothetical protein